MFTKQTLTKLIAAGSFLTIIAGCAQPPLPVPIVADMYYDKYSAVQSTGTGVDFCELNEGDFTPELVAQIRSNPNYERNLSVWLQECPELALAFADFGTATTAAASPFGGGGSPADGGFAGGENPGNLGEGYGPSDSSSGEGPGNEAPGNEAPGNESPGNDKGNDTGNETGNETGNDKGNDKGNDTGDDASTSDPGCTCGPGFVSPSTTA